MSLVLESQVEPIAKAIVDEMEIEKPGAGILFTLDVNKVTGLFEG